MPEHLDRGPGANDAGTTAGQAAAPARTFCVYPPADDRAADVLRRAVKSWAPLLAELTAVGFRPYLELDGGSADGGLHLFAHLDAEHVLELVTDMDSLPVARPQRRLHLYPWVAFILSPDGTYAAEADYAGEMPLPDLAGRLRALADDVLVDDEQPCIR